MWRPPGDALDDGAAHVQQFRLSSFEDAVRTANGMTGEVNPRATVPILDVHSRQCQRLFTEQFTILAH